MTRVAGILKTRLVIAEQLCIFLLASCWLSNAQSPPPASTIPDAPSSSSPGQSPAPVIRVTSRLVVVDVIVTDSKGQPVRDLKPSDFALLEDGNAQRIRFFEPHLAAPNRATAPASPPLQLPPHQYTNFPQSNPNAGITVVLLDMLNTARADQTYARQQMLQFLKTLPAHQPVALFTLTERLSMLQGFTSDSDALVAAAQSLLTQHPHLLTTEAQTERQEDAIQYVGRAISPGAAGADPGGLVAGLERALEQEEEIATAARAQTTVEALAAMAHVLAGYPGRKNLIWLSGSFPFRFGPDFSNDPLNNPQIYAAEIRPAAAALAASQVAVYPIDVRGTVTVGISADVNAEGNRGVATNAINSLNTIQSRVNNEQLETHAAMRDIAAQTGGEAFYGSNDLESAISRSFLHAANYYSLAYAPDNRNWDGHYRKIEVKLGAKNLKLDYRRGYYAIPDQSVQTDQAQRLLLAAMFPGLPEYTMLLLKVQILPPDPAHPNVRIEYAVAADDLTFADADAGKKHVTVDFAAMAWDKNGKQVAQVGNTLDGAFDAGALASIRRAGLPEHQELKLAPGTYRVRLGAIDLGNQKIGTLDLSLSIPE